MGRFDQNGIILNYTIYYRETPDNSSNYASITYVVPSTHSEDDEPFTAVISDLKGGTSYDVILQAYTSVGGGPNSTVVRLETMRGKNKNILFILFLFFIFCSVSIGSCSLHHNTCRCNSTCCSWGSAHFPTSQVLYKNKESEALLSKERRSCLRQKEEEGKEI